MAHEKLKPHFVFDEEKMKELKQIAPEAFADGKINWHTLKEALGEYTEEEGQDKEHFGLFWPGKRQARKLASIPSKGTLVPVPGDGVDEDTTKNIFIEGENLEVLKLLQKSYAGKIKMIYIDPPYNTGNDFVYDDDFTEPLQEYLKRTGQLDEEGKPLTTNTKADGRFHSKWLNMMYPRLRLARNLLRDDGVIFISIDDNEVHNLRAILNEIFGEENFVAQLVWLNKEGGGGSDSSFFRVKHEYVICFCKNILELSVDGIEISNLDRYSSKDSHYNERGPYYLQKLNQASIQYSKSLDFPIVSPGGEALLPRQGTKRACWRWSSRKVDWGLKNDFVEFKKDKSGVWQVYTKQYLKVDNNDKPIERSNRPSGVIENYSSTQASKILEKILGPKIFSYSKPHDLIGYLISLVCTSNDIVLDFFAGAGTIGHSVYEYNIAKEQQLSFIAVQLDEIIKDDLVLKAGYKNISQISLDRITKISRLLQKEHSSTQVDLGVKVFKLSKSHYKQWKNYEGYSVQELEKQFDLFETPLEDGWKEEKLLNEIVLLEGFPLDSKVEQKKEYKKNNVHQVSSEFYEHNLWICLDKKINSETITGLKMEGEDIFICLDNAITDEEKVKLSDKGLIKTI